MEYVTEHHAIDGVVGPRGVIPVTGRAGGRHNHWLEEVKGLYHSSPSFGQGVFILMAFQSLPQSLTRRGPTSGQA